VHGHALIDTIEKVVGCTGLQAVVERVDDDGPDVVTAVVGPARGREAPGPRPQCDELLSLRVQPRAVQRQRPRGNHQARSRRRRAAGLGGSRYGYRHGPGRDVALESGAAAAAAERESGTHVA